MKYLIIPILLLSSCKSSLLVTKVCPAVITIKKNGDIYVTPTGVYQKINDSMNGKRIFLIKRFKK